MTFNPNQISPPEPHPRDCVTCDQCGDDFHHEDMFNVGSDSSPVWICRDSSCLRHYAAEVTAELTYTKYRSAMLIKSVTQGLHLDGNQDFGQFDIVADVTADSMILKPNPDHGIFRVIQIAGE